MGIETTNSKSRIISSVHCKVCRHTQPLRETDTEQSLLISLFISSYYLLLVSSTHQIRFVLPFISRCVDCWLIRDYTLIGIPSLFPSICHLSLAPQPGMGLHVTSFFHAGFCSGICWPSLVHALMTVMSPLLPSHLSQWLSVVLTHPALLFILYQELHQKCTQMTFQTPTVDK